MPSLETFRSFGESLKAARIGKKRSLDDVADAIKINRRHLEAIEAGEFEKLPQGPYATAFLREYARALGIAVPVEFAHVLGASPASPRDPKVVSHPASGLQERSAHAARETARFANTAVKSAVKTVSKTTENVVNMVETGGKEAFEAITSKNLWEEAENIRRERHGLPPLERPVEPPSKRTIEERRVLANTHAVEEASPLAEPSSPVAEQRIPKPMPIRSSKRVTNIVIVLLALLFAGVAYLAIRKTKNESGSIANKDYIPAPVEKPQPLTSPKHEPASPTNTVASVKPVVKDSLRFVMRAIQPVWVSIAPDGIPAYRGELKTGEVRSFKAGEKFVVNIGNQKSVAMSFDGAALSALPAAPNSSVVVRDLILTRDHASLGGTTIDLHRSAISVLTSKPAASMPVKKSIAATAKKPALSSTSHKPVPKTPVKVVPHKATPVKKPSKKSSLPPGIIHPVEPIPPRP